jgi:dimethylglycine dehydrogenase
VLLRHADRHRLGPGLTRELARWMVHGAADISMRDYDPRRFGSYATKEWQVVKAKEDYCLRHEIPFPHFNRLAGRPIKPSPLYETLKAKGAVHEEVYGFERPRWFAKDDVAQEDHYSFRRTVVDDMVAAEVKAVRERRRDHGCDRLYQGHGRGPDAYALLDRLTANRMPQKVGSITLTHMLNRARPDRAGNHHRAHGRGSLLPRLRGLLRTASAGPSRHPWRGSRCDRHGIVFELGRAGAERAAGARYPGRCTDARLDNASFRWLSAQEIEVAGHKIWAFRMSYAGELGWELHMPFEAMQDVYDALWRRGAAWASPITAASR